MPRLPRLSTGLIQRLGLAALLATGLAGCTQSNRFILAGEMPITDVQECAIAYDLSQQIYARVRLTTTTIIAPRTESDCEEYALQYLALAGYQIDRSTTASANDTFDVDLIAREPNQVLAVASIGDDLRMSRVYSLADRGVYPASPVSVLAIPAHARYRGQ